MVHNPGGHWNPVRGPHPSGTYITSLTSLSKPEVFDAQLLGAETPNSTRWSLFIPTEDAGGKGNM